MAGRSYTEQDIYDWLNQNGGTDNFQYSRQMRAVGGAGADDLDPTKFQWGKTTPEKAVVETWVNPKNGAKFSVVNHGDGRWEEVDVAGPKPGGGNEPARTPEQREREAQEAVERKRNSEKYGVPLTDVALDAKLRQDRLDAEARGDKNLANEIAKKQSEIAAARLAMDQEKAKRDALAAKSELVKTEDGRYLQKHVDDQGNVTFTEVEKPPEKGAAFQPEKFVADPTKPGYGLYDRYRYYQELVAQGKITDAIAQKWFAADRGEAEAYRELEKTRAAREQQNAQSEVVQRGQDVNLATNRATVAGSMFNNTLDATLKANQMLRGRSDVGGRAFLASLLLGQQFTKDMGGLETPPRVVPGPYQQGLGLPTVPGYEGLSPLSPGAAMPGIAPGPGAGAVQAGPGGREMTFDMQPGSWGAGAPTDRTFTDPASILAQAGQMRQLAPYATPADSLSERLAGMGFHPDIIGLARGML